MAMPANDLAITCHNFRLGNTSSRQWYISCQRINLIHVLIEHNPFLTRFNNSPRPNQSLPVRNAHKLHQYADVPMRSNPSSPVRMVARKRLRAKTCDNCIILAKLQLARDLLISSSLRVIVQRNTDSTTVVSVVLPDNQLTLQLPESGIMIRACSDKIG